MPEVTQRQIDDANKLQKRRGGSLLPNLPKRDSGGDGTNRSVPLPIRAADTVVSGINKAADIARRGINTIAYPAQLGQQLLSQGIDMTADAFSGRKSPDFQVPDLLINKGDELTLPSAKYQKTPEGNVDALSGINQTAPLFNLAETATQQPGYVSREGVEAIRTAKDLETNQNIGDKIPEDYIATLDGFKPKQDVLPGNDFNKANTEDYFKQTGYIPDDDPHMIKRRQEAQEVQAGRKRFLADSAAGIYDLGGLSAAGGGKNRTTNALNRPRPQQSLARSARKGVVQQQQQSVDLPKPISREDQIDTLNQGIKFGQEFSSKIVPGLPPVVGEEVFKLISADMPLTKVQSLLDEVLIKLKSDKNNTDANIIKDPGEIVSLLKERIRNE